jgi:hypothetical protein
MRMRLPITKLEERVSSKGTRYLTGDWGSSRLVIVERSDGWTAYLAGESESATTKPAKRRAPKAPRRATAKKRKGTLLAGTPIKVPSGEGFPFDDDLSGIGT